MLEWIRDNPAAISWLGIASAVMFVASLVVVPAVVIALPADYFLRRVGPSRPGAWGTRHPAASLGLRVARNILGLVLIPAGIAMLVLPGQGLLAIIAGILLVDFPGKYRLERWLVSRASVLRALNWVRRKAGKPPFLIDPRPGRPSAASAGAPAA